MTPEAKVKQDIRKLFASYGLWPAGQPKAPDVVMGWYYMPVPAGFGVNGIPDFCGIFMGRPLYVEAKASTGEPTANQLQRAKEIVAAGGYHIITSSIDDVRALLEKIRRETNK